MNPRQRSETDVPLAGAEACWWSGVDESSSEVGNETRPLQARSIRKVRSR